MKRRFLPLALPLLLIGCERGIVTPEPEVWTLPTAYTLTDLGTLGGNSSLALGLNDAGVIVGNSRTTTNARPLLAFRWQQGAMSNLGSLPGSTFSRAFSINRDGAAVGEAFTAPSPEISRAVIWAQGGITDLGTLGAATGAVATDINDRGQITGGSGGRAVMWDAQGIRDLGTISTVATATSRAAAINNHGHVVGRSQTDILNATGGRVTHGFLWNGTSMVDLGTLGASTNYSDAFAVNDSSVVVGEAMVESGTYHAWVWRNGTMTSLHPAEFELRHSRANRINTRGVIVGHVARLWGFASSDGRAVLWHDGKAYDLNQYLPENSGWVLRSAEGINDKDQIVGLGSFQGENRAFLLTPVR
jgi:probable HAF family extracellular repeat protein